MGFAVIHLEKAKGSDSGMSAHIERTIAPKNADEERTHLNLELITFPDGVDNRTQAIQHRLNTAGLTRKIANNQVRAIRVMLSGTHEDMAKIESEGRLDEWCSDNLDWLQQTYGADNVVSAVLHLDEKTPHIHATVIPIVATERKRRKREESVKKTYRKKKPTPRLCADEVMSRQALKGYQDNYAKRMAKYGLERGIDGSKARHISTSEYYRELQQQSDSLQENISELLEQQAQAEKELSATKAEVSKERLKNSAADVGSKLMDGVGSLLGTPKFAKLETKIKNLEAKIVLYSQHIKELTEINEAEKARHQTIVDGFKEVVTKEMTQMEYNHHQQLERLKEQHNEEVKTLKEENKTLKERLTKIFDLFPKIAKLLNFEGFLRKVGFPIEMIRRLFDREEVGFSGNLYSGEYGRNFEAKNSTARIVTDKEHNPKLHIDGIEYAQWFGHKKREQLKAMGINIQEPQQRRGRKM